MLARGASCTNVRLERLIAGVKKASLDVHDISLASGSAHVLGYEVFPAIAYCSGTGKRISRIRSVARTVSSRLRIGGRAMEPSTVTSLFWRSAVVELSQFLMQVSSFAWASYLVSGAPWSNCAYGAKSIWRQSCVFSAVIGVFVGVTSASVRMHRKRASHLRFVKDAASWPRRLVESSERTRFKRTPRSIRTRSRALRSIAPDVVLECTSSDEDVVSLAQRESRADFWEVSLQLLDPSEWELGGVWWLLSRGNQHSSRSTFHLCMLLIVSDYLALVLALCKERSTHFTLLSVMRRIFASGFRAGF